jgi:methylenetetrahydrofolate reductase (NADPH)
VPAAHLTCVDATREEVDEVVRAYGDGGVRHIVALRGDPAGGVGAAYEPHPGGYANAADLVAGIKRIGDFEVSVAAYPEKHPESAGGRSRHRHAQAQGRRRRDAGDHAVLLRERQYFRYLDRVRARGIEIPIVPGHRAGAELQAGERFAERCGASVPDWLAERFEGSTTTRDPQADRRRGGGRAGARSADRGRHDFHFYTMNRADLVYAICHLLGLRPGAAGRRERRMMRKI